MPSVHLVSAVAAVCLVAACGIASGGVLRREDSCLTSEGVQVSKGHVQHHPDDGCLSEVCRCASEGSCKMESERRMVLIRVNETKTTDTGASVTTQTMQCTCVDHLLGSQEMDFLCKSLTHPGRDVGARMKGCLNTDGVLRLPGEKVRIQNLRTEQMECDCNDNGHYENCLPLTDLDERCQDSETEQRVPLGSTYHRNELNSSGRSIKLRCICVRSDMETSCTVVN